MTGSLQSSLGSSTPTEQSQTLRLRQNIQALLDQRDFTAALALIAKASNHAENQQFKAEAVQALNGLLSDADHLMTTGDHAQAGLLFKQVKDHFPASPDQASQISLSAKELDRNLTLCADALMDAGLSAYRTGELAAALASWRQVLAFDAENLNALNAIQTTEKQLENLKTLDQK